MICMNCDHNKKFGLLKFYSGYEKFNLNSPKGYSLKIINVQTGSNKMYCRSLEENRPSIITEAVKRGKTQVLNFTPTDLLCQKNLQQSILPGKHSEIIIQGFPLPLTTGGHLEPLTFEIEGHLKFCGVKYCKNFEVNWNFVNICNIWFS